MSRVYFEADVDTADVVHSLMSLTQEEMLEVIKELDITVGDWDFTELVADYYEEQMHQLAIIRTPEHTHDYVGDSDDCQAYPGCPVTWREYIAMSRRGEV